MTNYFDRLESRIESVRRKYGTNQRKCALKMALWTIKNIFPELERPSFSDTFAHIAIAIAGGLGDLITAGKYTKALSVYAGENVKIDIVTEHNDFDTVKRLFKSLSFVNAIVDETQNSIRYDLEIKLVRFPVLSTVFEHRLLDRLKRYVDLLKNFYKMNYQVIKNDFLGRCYSEQQGRNRENESDIDNFLGMADIDFPLPVSTVFSEIAAKFKITAGDFFIVQSGAGRHFEYVNNESRQWPLSYYEQLISLIKNVRPNVQIIQVGNEKQSRINGVDIDLRGKTNLDELCCLLKNAKLLVSQEGGMPILRHFLGGGKSCVLFGPTKESFFGFSENINLTARPCSYPCEWLTRDWMEKCAITGNRAQCMNDLTPEFVFEKIKKDI